MQTTDYNKQAQDFLDKHQIKFRATLSDSKVAPWEADKRGDEIGKVNHHYRVTLSKGKPCSGRYTGNIRASSRITFDYFGSIADAGAGKTEVQPYDVLACISGDVHTQDTFKEFCADFGESEDSIKALQTFRRVSAFSKRLRAFFTEAELEDLCGIQ